MAATAPSQVAIVAAAAPTVFLRADGFEMLWPNAEGVLAEMMDVVPVRDRSD